MVETVVTIRPARKGEGAAVSRLMQETWHATYDAILDPPSVEAITTVWHAPDRIERQIGIDGLVFLVADQEGEIVGHALGRAKRADDIIILQRLYVAPNAQRRRLGRRLLAAVIEGLPPARTIRLQVALENVGAVRFYESHGFRRVGTPEPWEGDRRIHDVTMERRVTSKGAGT